MSDATRSGQLLRNAAFEEGAADWTFDGAVEIGTTEELGLPVSEAGPQVVLLGREDDEIDRVSQDVRVPGDAHTLELSGLRCFATDETGGTAFDTLTIFLESEDGLTADVVLSESNLESTTATCQWMAFEVATEDHAGERLRLVIEAVMDPDVETRFALDGLALTASP